jgi:hypothetical protein
VIQNTSEEILRGSDIHISVSAPKFVDVSVERSRFENGSWHPRYDMNPGEDLVIPILIRPQVYRQETGGEISLRIEVDGDAAEETITLLS